MDTDKGKKKIKCPPFVRPKYRKGKLIGFEYRKRENDNDISLFAKTIAELQEKIDTYRAEKRMGIKKEKSNIRLDDLYEEKMKSLEGLIKPNTLANYKDMYENYVKERLGHKKVVDIERNDIHALYLYLLNEKGLKKNSIANVQTVIHPILDEAVDRNIILYNPSDNAMKKMKYKRVKGHKKGLTVEQTQILFKFLKRSKEFKRWYSLLLFMFETGLRVGEVSALQNYDLMDDKIQVDKTLVDYPLDTDKGRITRYEIHSAKTSAGLRRIPLSEKAKEAIRLEKEQHLNMRCVDSLPVIFTDDDYDNDLDDMISTKYKKKKEFIANDFLFLNREQRAYKSSTINRAIKRIRDACNKDYGSEIIPEDFSCHTSRHTYTTRLNDARVNEKGKHALLGHADEDITNAVYVDITDTTLYDSIKQYEEFVEKNNIY